jgi:Ca2+-binding RTX toxin-like protein
MPAIYGNDWSNILVGTLTDDSIHGFGGDDDLYGRAGDDRIDGGSGFDILFGGNGHDTLDGGAGPDDLYGGSGSDVLAGGSGFNFMFGEAGADRLQGGSDFDNLYGGAGQDTLAGGGSDDLLAGGPGMDRLAGGAGIDLFAFGRGDSGITTATADTITDWRAASDLIHMTIPGTPANYREGGTAATSIEAAAAEAEARFPGQSIVHVFLYNSQADTGYLLSDLNRDHLFDTGIVMSHAGHAADLSYLYII